MGNGNDLERFFQKDTSAKNMASFECRYLEDITQHIKTYVGPYNLVSHEIVSFTVHVDIHMIPPNQSIPYFTIVTSGMSDKLMPVPAEDREAFGDGLAEMIAFLPPTWFRQAGAEKGDGSEAHLDWAEDMARSYASGVHESHSFFDWYHSTSNGSPPSPFISETEMSGFIIAPPTALPEAAWTIPTHDGKSIRLLNMVPILVDEIEYAIEQGGFALCKKLESKGFKLVFDADRKSCLVESRKLFGLF